MQQIDINPNFQKALDLLEKTNKHIFITGEAGTGKSTLLSYFRSITSKPLAVVAPTGVAAVNVNGETIHSFFGFRPGVSPTDAKRLAGKSRKKEVFKALTTLIIDEISMVRADLLDTIDAFLRAVRQSQAPFGGVQLVMIGDLFQLPPIVTEEEKEILTMAYQSPYFFSAVSFENLLHNLLPDFAFIELDQIYRQNEPEFISLLNKIRNKTATPGDLTFLNQRVRQRDSGLVLTATNWQADQINNIELNKLTTKSFEYRGFSSGHFSTTQFPTAEKLILKQGARVMLLNNEPGGLWINGTLGTVTKTSASTVKVKIDDGAQVEVKPFTWNQLQTIFDHQTNSLKQEEIGSFTQLPLRLAWAVTIHKAQGKSFDCAHVDLGRGAFAHGQAYVALSRCRSLSGLSLARPVNPRDIMLDPVILQFMDQIRQYNVTV